MLSAFGWLMVVWAIWTVIAIITLMLVRFTMHDQQEVVTEQEASINAWNVQHGLADASAVTGGPAPAPSRPAQPERRPERRPPPEPFAPPLSAT